MSQTTQTEMTKTVDELKWEKSLSNLKELYINLSEDTYIRIVASLVATAPSKTHLNMLEAYVKKSHSVKFYEYLNK